MSKLERIPFNNIDLLKEVYKKKRTNDEKLVRVENEPEKEVKKESEKPSSLVIPAVTISKDNIVLPVRFICLKEQKLDFSKLYECNWLYSLFGDFSTVTIDYVDLSSSVPTDCPIFILQRPHVLNATKLLLEWSKCGVKFKILHLSDEITEDKFRDPLLIYQLPNCISVLRTYIRDDFPPGTEDKIKVIPLGYRWSPLNSSQNPLLRTPNLPFRENHWCFFGTDWNGRSELLKPIINSNLLKSYKVFPNWNDPSGLSREEYIYEMTNSVFVPCPDGVNPETFRFYEALEAGCIPLIVKTEKNAIWFKWVSNYIPLIANDTWDDALRIMYTLLSNPRRLEVYRDAILKGWWKWNQDLKRESCEWLLKNN